MAPRTRSTPSAEIEPDAPRVVEETQTIVEGTPLPMSDVDETLTAINERIRKLEELKEAREREAILRAELATGPLADPRRNQTDSLKARSDIKFENVPTFALEYNLQKRQEWLLDLSLMFKGAPSKYFNDGKKIIGAVSHMDQTCRQRWYRHLAERALIDSRNLDEDWSYFEKWTLSLLSSTASLESSMASEREKAHQGKDEDPREFHARLDTLEQYFERPCEAERARVYFAKLQYDLQYEVREHVRELPKNREDMIDVAHHYWELMKIRAKRGRKTNEESTNNPRKRKAPIDTP
jgi:hypothetical protein